MKGDVLKLLFLHPACSQTVIASVNEKRVLCLRNFQDGCLMKIVLLHFSSAGLENLNQCRQMQCYETKLEL